jgi:hypothetical protein
MRAHVRLSTRLRNQTEFTKMAEAGGLKESRALVDGLGVVVVAFGDPGSCWDIWARRDWVMELGSRCRL